MFEIYLTNRAEKALKLLNPKMKTRIETVLDDLVYSYFPKKYDIKKLRSVDDTYRTRIGTYRIIYVVDFKKSRILILSIGQRKKSYKILH
jgi:mRNA interferase RelE/StbE